jgi:hypothetical protein
MFNIFSLNEFANSAKIGVIYDEKKLINQSTIDSAKWTGKHSC